MTPIQEILNRIRWDADFARAQFELGYFDRVEGHVLVVPIQSVEFPPEDPRAFRLVDAEGRFHRVPFHRVCEVYKDGQCIWHRGKREPVGHRRSVNGQSGSPHRHGSS